MSNLRHPVVIAHHLIWVLYGHWLPNDPRGSGSCGVYSPELKELGEAYFGRKARHEQPSREALRRFYELATPRLKYPVFWIDQALRQAIAEQIARSCAANRYTVWGCAILRNHIHMLIRRHRDTSETMWWNIASDTARVMREQAGSGVDHPVWGQRPYWTFKDSPDTVRDCVGYIEGNPRKEGLADQAYPFVWTYDGWPRGWKPRIGRQ
ncbi:MAG: transposase [Phycisphaerales bacterium]